MQSIGSGPSVAGEEISVPLDSDWSDHQGGTPARLGYYDNYLVDNDSCVIVGVQATAARMSQETVAAQDMLTRFAQWQGRAPESVAADTTYGNGEFLQWLADRGVTPYMRTRDSIHRKRSPFFGPEHFTYEPEHNRYICPAGQFLNYGGRVYRNRAFNYIGTRKKCGPCALRPQCTSADFRGLIIHQNEPARQRARELVNTPEFAKSTAPKKEGGSLVRGTEESDRIAALASAETQIRARAVLPGRGSPEHQTTSAIPQSGNNTRSAGHHLAEPDTRNPATPCPQMNRRSIEGLFQHPQAIALKTPFPLG